MSLQRQIIFWAVTFLAFVVFLWVFRSILLPFVAGMAIAYLLDPVADRLETLGMSRLVATSVILFTLLICVFVVLLLLIPPIARQVVELFQELLKYIPGTLKTVFGVTDAELEKLGAVIAGRYDGDLWALLNFNELKSFFENNAEMLFGIAGRVFNSGVAAVNIIGLLVVTPVVAFYLLLDWDLIVAAFNRQLPREHASTVRTVIGDIDGVLAGFVRGQVLMCIFLGAFYAVALTVVGLKFGLVIGLGAGLVSFIPYVGAFIALVASVGVALFQFWSDPIWILVVFGVFLVGQFFEGNVLQPNLVGPAVGLHPVSLMFALFAFGSMFGFLGMLVAVPAAAAIGVLVRFALDQYRASAIYKGSGVILPGGEETR